METMALEMEGIGYSPPPDVKGACELQTCTIVRPRDAEGARTSWNGTRWSNGITDFQLTTTQEMVVPREAYLHFAVAPTINPGSLGARFYAFGMSAVDMIESVTIIDKFNQTIETRDRPDITAGIVTPLREGSDWIKNGQGSLARFSPNNSQLKPQLVMRNSMNLTSEYEDSGAFEDRLEVSIPMHLLCGLFDTDVLLPPQLVSGLTIRIQWANPYRALSGWTYGALGYVVGSNIPPVSDSNIKLVTDHVGLGYDVSDVHIRMQVRTIAEPIRKAIDQMYQTQGLAFTFKSWVLTDAIPVDPHATTTIPSKHIKQTSANACTVLLKVEDAFNSSVYPAADLSIDNVRNKPAFDRLVSARRMLSGGIPDALPSPMRININRPHAVSSFRVNVSGDRSIPNWSTSANYKSRHTQETLLWTMALQCTDDNRGPSDLAREIFTDSNAALASLYRGVRSGPFAAGVEVSTESPLVIDAVIEPIDRVSFRSNFEAAFPELRRTVLIFLEREVQMLLTPERCHVRV